MGQCQTVEVDEPIEERKWVSSVNRFLMPSAHFPPNTVWLNVYNMFLINETTSKFGLGVYHTGVEVFGEEFAFSGSLKDKSGLRRCQPGDASWLQNAYFSQSIKLGTTDLSQEEVREKFDSLHDEYHARRYSVVDRNCKHFTRDFCQEILALEHMSYPDTLIPPFVDRVERTIAMCRCLMPKSWTRTLAEQGQQQKGFFCCGGASQSSHRPSELISKT